ncbi:MAG: small multi-drug export protein [Clostridia bacterium]|nr:small multi-drug export protein [Clostridia bacterium]
MIERFLVNPGLLAAAAEGAFVWQEHTRQIVTAALLSMVPTFEGRYAVTVALGMGMPPVFSYLLALICSSLPVPFILLLLRPVLDWFYTLPIKPVRSFAAWLERHAAKKRAAMNEKNAKGLRGRLSADAAELFALYVFVALPLPGTGVWTGSAIATLFNLPRGKAALAILLGNVTACLIMTLMATGFFAIV